MKCAGKIIIFLLPFISSLECLTETLPNPLSELLTVLDDCPNLPGTNSTISDVSSCLAEVFSENQKDSTPGDKMSIECRDPWNYRLCYSSAKNKLNQCIPGRGDEVQRIHDAIYNQFCADSGGTIFHELSNHMGDGCSAKFDVSECTSDEAIESWESLDICKSFGAYKKCQESALATCQHFKVTQIMLERYRLAETSLSCYQEFLPFPTPLQEFNRIQGDCEAKGIIDAKKALSSFRKCARTEKDVLGASSVLENCEELKVPQKCWDLITEKIDECQPGRGRSVGEIYSTLSAITCQDKDILKSFSTSSQGCTQNATDVVACRDIAEMTAPEICKSFRAQRKCEESMLSSCQNSEHKAIVLRHLDTAEQKLKCSSQSSGNEIRPWGGNSSSKGLNQLSVMLFSLVLFGGSINNR